MKKLPYGVSNYDELVEENYYYVDKTKYIEKLEDLAEKRIMFLRPRKFGKTLFTSVLENYYDVNKKDKFEELFGETYIGKNPTEMKNSYYILRFNFSGINTKDEETTMEGFKENVKDSIQKFVNRYEIDFYINPKLSTEGLLNSLITAFEYQKQNEKMYVIIDEYDHFANESIRISIESFKNLVSKNGQIRKWYEVLKRGTESVVDRIFITGVAPITLDSMTSGFNIVTDLTRDPRFNEMMGFTEEELVKIMEVQEIEKEKQEELLPIMKENYDGYRFSTEVKENRNLYNSNMCLYFLNSYISFGKIPEELIDVNIASDYNKVGNMLKLCRNENRLDIIGKTVLGEKLVTKIIQKFNPETTFGERELLSMLYYLGYLTIVGKSLGMVELKVPNQVMKEIYAEYFIELIEKETDLRIKESEYQEILKDIAIEGKIGSLVNIIEKYLKNLSNRDYENFDEKYIKLFFFSISMSFEIYNVISEMEIERGYSDLILLPKDKEYYSIIIEFKYLKKTEEKELQKEQKEAKKQLEKYCRGSYVKDIKKIKKYTVVAVVDKLYVEEI